MIRKKFVAITSAEGYLYALDDAGAVWQYGPLARPDHVQFSEPARYGWTPLRDDEPWPEVQP